MPTDDNQRREGKRKRESWRHSHLENPRPCYRTLLMGSPKYILFESACGYFLILVKDGFGPMLDAKWPQIENFINRDQIFKLVAFHRFVSSQEALEHYRSILDEIVPERLTTFLSNNLPKEKYVGGLPAYSLILKLGNLDSIVPMKMRIPSTEIGILEDYIIRGIRIHIRNLVKDLKAEDMEKAIRNLARSYIAESPFLRMAQRGQGSVSKQGQGTNKAAITVAPSSLKLVACSTGTPFTPAVVPHKLIEGVFVGPGDVLYTKNQYYDGLGADYTECSPNKSKLASAILNGARNIGIKSGSHVLCLGNECETTIANISNLVGPGGLIYVVGRKNVEFSGRSNIISINAKPGETSAYHMLVDMVDVMILTVDDNYKDSCGIAAFNAKDFLKSNGFYLTYDEEMKRGPTCAYLKGTELQQREFHPLQQISLKPHDLHHDFIIGNFRKSCFM